MALPFLGWAIFLQVEPITTIDTYRLDFGRAQLRSLRNIHINDNERIKGTEKASPHTHPIRQVIHLELFLESGLSYYLARWLSL